MDAQGQSNIQVAQKRLSHLKIPYPFNQETITVFNESRRELFRNFHQKPSVNGYKRTKEDFTSLLTALFSLVIIRKWIWKQTCRIVRQHCSSQFFPTSPQKHALNISQSSYPGNVTALPQARFSYPFWVKYAPPPINHFFEGQSKLSWFQSHACYIVGNPAHAIGKPP